LAPKGCAAKPFDKKKIAVFGAGGYLGAVVFGFLQRAASL
jgi:shikimate 5-dehydrogenase